MAVRKEYDVGILMSTDTDLKPALETVAQLTTSTGPRPEAAAWREKDLRDRRLDRRQFELLRHELSSEAKRRAHQRLQESAQVLIL